MSEAGHGMSAARSSRLERPELGFVVDELVRRYTAGDAPTTLTLRGSSPDARRALADLLGIDRPLPDPVRISVVKLVRVLGLTSAAELRHSVERLRGPLPDRRAERAEKRMSREAMWVWLGSEAAAVRLGDLETWVDTVRSAGVRGEVAKHQQRLATALEVLRSLPRNGVSLANLANDVTGDPHALDPGHQLNTLVLDGIACATGADRATDAESARALWESVGVAPDVLSSSVLALGLPGSDNDPLGRWLDAAAGAGEPVVLTLAMLRRWPPPALPAQAAAYVVENPSLISEAASRSWSGPPLICSYGRPSVAVVTLLRQLASQGAQMRQHADFDPSGLAITAWLADRAGTIPWRMSSTDYLAAAQRLQSPLALGGAVPPTPWDPNLQVAMSRERVAVYEEEVREELLDAVLLP